MWEFLQTYGIWILFIVLFVLMMRMHGGGMHGGGMGGGCGMGMGHDQHDQQSNRQRVVPLGNEQAEEQRAIPLDEYTGEQQVMSAGVEYSDAERKSLMGGEYNAAQQASLARKGTGEEGGTAADGYASRRHSRGC